MRQSTLRQSTPLLREKIKLTLDNIDLIKGMLQQVAETAREAFDEILMTDHAFMPTDAQLEDFSAERLAKLMVAFSRALATKTSNATTPESTPEATTPAPSTVSTPATSTVSSTTVTPNSGKRPVRRNLESEFTARI